MNDAIRFFNRNLGRHLVAPSGDEAQDADDVFGKAYVYLNKDGKPFRGRLTYGWAVVEEGVAISSLQIPGQTGIHQSKSPQAEAWCQAIERASPTTPIMLIQFMKATLPHRNLVRTVDPRCIAICSAKRVDYVDLSVEPGTNSSLLHRMLWKGRSQ